MRLIISILLGWLSLSKDTCGIDNKSVKRATASIPKPPESAPVISAVLLKCPKLLREGNEKHAGKYCHSENHIMVNIRVNPSFHVEKVDKFLILDEIFDTGKQSKAKIMSPYLIEIRRGEPIMMYPLDFSMSLNPKYENNNQTFDNISCNNQNVKSSSQYIESGHQLDSLKRVFMKIMEAISPTVAIKAEDIKENKHSVFDNISKNKQRSRNAPTQKQIEYKEKECGTTKFSDRSLLKQVESITSPNIEYLSNNALKLKKDLEISSFITMPTKEKIASMTRRHNENKYLSAVDPIMNHGEITNKNKLAKHNITLQKWHHRAFESKRHVDLQRENNVQCVSEQKQQNKKNNDNWQGLRDEIKSSGYSQNLAVRSWKTPPNLRRRKGCKRINKYALSKYCKRPTFSSRENNNLIHRGQVENTKFFEGSKETLASASPRSVIGERHNEFNTQRAEVFEGPDCILKNGYSGSDGNQCISSRNIFYQDLKPDMLKELGEYNIDKLNKKNSNTVGRRARDPVCNERNSQKEIKKEMGRFWFNGIHAFAPKQVEYSLDIHTNYPKVSSFEGIELFHEARKNLDTNIVQRELKRDKTPFLSSGMILKDLNSGRSDIHIKSLKSDDSNSNYKRFYSNASPQSTEGLSATLQNQQSCKYLPKSLQFERINNDSHLNLFDKLKMIGVMSSYNGEIEAQLKTFPGEMENPLLAKPKSRPIPLTADALDAQGILANSKHKRSLIFYDDLTIRNTQNDKDYNFEAIESKPRNVDCDIMPCSSCGGKNKKPQGKTDSSVIPRNNKCNCGIRQKECICSPKKTPRSIADSWYSVFNMNAPLPFLMTTLRIYRKRKNTWFKIAPSITLNSLTGIYTNTNLSILFSCHVDIIQLEKSLRLQNHQLLIPRDDISLFPRKVSDKFVNNETLVNNSYDINNVRILKPNHLGPENISRICITNGEQRSNLNKHHSVSPSNAIKKSIKVRRHNKCWGQTIAELGHFPATMSILDRCPNNLNRLCLNMLGDKVPVMVKFNEKKRITNLTHQRRSAVFPSKNEMDNKVVENTTTISSRTLVVEMDSRCFCVWKCKCHCTSKLEPHVKLNICQEMDLDEGHKAGMLLDYSYDDGLVNDSYISAAFSENGFQKNGKSGIYFCLENACILLLLMLLLGFFKAFFGRICSEAIDRSGFDYTHPGKGYDDSSRCRRFIINIFFFIAFPFFFLCKCFTLSDLDLLAASAEWQCENDFRTPVLSENKICYSGKEKFVSKKGEVDEQIILSQHIDHRSKPTSGCDNCINHRIRLSAGKSFYCPENHLDIVRSAVNEKLLDKTEINEDEEEENTKYVLKTLAESRESIKKMLRSSSLNVLNVAEEITEKLHQSAELVETLKDARIVYRVLDYPVGNVQNIPYGITYCVQGYFLPSSEEKYEFVSYHPLVQYYGISSDGNFIDVLHPPVLLCPKEFSRVYDNPLDVLCAHDLHTYPPSCVPCINVTSIDYVSTSLMNLALNKGYSGDNGAAAISQRRFSYPFDNSRTLGSANP